MAVTAEQVRAALLAEEPDYAKLAKTLGTDAVPHLSALVGSEDALLAAKATYLAGVIGGPSSGDVVAKAAGSGQPSVRVAAASAARKLAAAPATEARGRDKALTDSDSILLRLVDDADPGVRKVALRSLPSTMSDALRERVTAQRAAGKASAPKARNARKKAGPAGRGKKKHAAGAARGRKAAGAAARGRKRRS